MTTAQLVDCTHLHSAFGPGCPHCWQPAGQDGETGPGTRPPAPAEPDRPESR